MQDATEKASRSDSDFAFNHRAASDANAQQAFERAACDKAIKLDEHFAQAREYRGETCLALGMLDRAREEVDYLKTGESPCADTLAASIELYRPEEIDTKMKRQ